MAFSLGDRIESKLDHSTYQSLLSHFQGDWVEWLNIEQMFVLIDGVLPFEACLYYQVLPLFLEGSHLNLGMVCPEDSSATDYVRRIISYLNYTLVPRRISSEALQAALSAHLSYAGERSSSQDRLIPSLSRLNRNSSNPKSGQSSDRNTQATLVVDSPEHLNTMGDHHPTAAAQPEPPPEIPFVPLTMKGVPPAVEIDTAAESTAPTQKPVQEADTATPPEAPLPVRLALPRIDIHPQFLSSPVEVLATLAPKTLLQELLGRILFGGIGRLYFERQAQYGRILWSQNGVLQSVLEKLDLDLFQGVINELKLMTQLPLIPVQKPKQVEIERMYEQTRLLLRFRVMPVEGGEEATLQILRGAALKFYQQQQLNNLGRDALSIARQLQLKVNEIRDRSYSDAGIANARLESLPAIAQLLQSIESVLDTLQEE